MAKFFVHPQRRKGYDNILTPFHKTAKLINCVPMISFSISYAYEDKKATVYSQH